MKIQTRDIGTVDISAEQILEFVEPILGFERRRRYVLLPIPGADPFFQLQSVEEPGLAFPVVNAETLEVVAYQLNAQQLRTVGAASPAQAQVWVIVTFPDEQRGIRLNLRGPVVVNPGARLGAQFVMSEQYPVSCELSTCASAGVAGG